MKPSLVLLPCIGLAAATPTPFVPAEAENAPANSFVKLFQARAASDPSAASAVLIAMSKAIQVAGVPDTGNETSSFLESLSNDISSSSVAARDGTIIEKRASNGTTTIAGDIVTALGEGIEDSDIPFASFIGPLLVDLGTGLDNAGV